MSNLNNRVKKIEAATATGPASWRDFITGIWRPTAAAWAAFVAEREKTITYGITESEGLNHEQPKQQS